MRQQLEQSLSRINDEANDVTIRNDLLKGMIRYLRMEISRQQSVVKDKAQQEVINKMSQKYKEQLRERESELIKQKRQLYQNIDALDDLQYKRDVALCELAQSNEELQALDQSISKMMDSVQEQKKNKKSGGFFKGRIATSQSTDEGHRNSFNFLGLLKTKNVDDNVDKVERSYNTSRIHND